MEIEFGMGYDLHMRVSANLDHYTICKRTPMEIFSSSRRLFFLLHSIILAVFSYFMLSYS